MVIITYTSLTFLYSTYDARRLASVGLESSEAGILVICTSDEPSTTVLNGTRSCSLSTRSWVTSRKILGRGDDWRGLSGGVSAVCTLVTLGLVITETGDIVGMFSQGSDGL